MDATDSPGSPEAVVSQEVAPPGLLGCIEGRLTFYIADYKRKRDLSRARSTLIKAGTIIVSALITVLAGFAASSLADPLKPQLGLVILVLGASLTGIAAWEAFADHRWKWVRYRATLGNLYTIEDDLNYRKMAETPITRGEADEFFNRLRQAVHETNQEWTSQRAQTLRSQPNKQGG